MAKDWSWDFTPANLNPQLGRPQVGFPQGAGVGFTEGLESTIPGLGYRHLRTLGGARISKEEFEQSVYAKSGLTWNNRMTWAEADAAYEAKIDKELYDDVSRRMTTAGRVGEFVGGFAGAVLDPVNLLPLGTVNVARGFAYNVAKIGAVNAAIEATLYQPLEAYVTRREQQPYTASQYALNVAMAAGVGGLFGAIGRGLAGAFEDRTLRLGELGESRPPIDNGPTQTVPLTPSQTPLQAPTSAVQGQGGATAPQLAPNSAAAAPQTTQAGGTMPPLVAQDATTATIRFPDANHQRFYNIDPTNPADLAWLDRTGYTLADVGTYREAVERRLKTLDGATGADKSIPAPHINSVNFERSTRAFTDPTFADNVQQRFKQLESTGQLKQENSNLARDRVLQEEQQARAQRLAEQDDPMRPVPEKEPEEGVLMLSTSEKTYGEVKEVSMKEWLRRLFNPAFGEGLTRRATKYAKLRDTKVGTGSQDARLGLRKQVDYTVFERVPDWESKFITKLQRLTPEQLDYALYRLINEAEIGNLTKHLGGTPTTREANARFIQEQIQPRGREFTPPSNLADRTIDAMSAERVAELQARLDAEAKLVNSDAVAAHDALTGVDTVKTAADADKFVRDRFPVEALSANDPAAAKAAQRIERLQKRQKAILDTMACLIGARS